MPQNPYRQVNGPQGPINFPADMNDEQVTQAMQKLYPPKQAAAPINRGPAYDLPSRSDAAIGRAVPEFMSGPLAWAQQHYVDPMNRYLAKAGEAGKEFGRDLLGEGADPNVRRKFGMDKSPTLDAALNATGKAGEFAGPIVADPRNWPLMGTGGFVKGLVGAEIGGHVGSGLAKRAGGGEATQGLSGLVGGSLGAAVGAGPDFLREHYNAALENTKADLRAGRGFGARLDETQVQRAAEEIVQKAAAQSNSPTQLIKTARDLTLITLKSGAMVGGAEQDLTQKFGKHAEYAPEAVKPMPTPAEVESKLLASQTPPELQPKPEVKTRPVTQVEKVEQIAKALTPEQEIEQLRAQRAQEVITNKAEIAALRASNPRAFKEPDVVSQVPEDATRLEKKQAAMKARQTKEAEAAGFIAQHREGFARELEENRLQLANAKLRDQQTSSSEVGRQAAPPETSKPKPIQTQAPKGPGEPVRPAKEPALADIHKALSKALQEEMKLDPKTAKETAASMMATDPAKFLASDKVPDQVKLFLRMGQQLAEKVTPKVEGEPRSLRGDLGERPPASGQPDFAKRIELQRQMVESMQADPRFKGVAKARLQEIANEQIKKQRGSFGGGGPDDVHARREAKINDWIKQLRDPKTDPASLDTAFKQLQAYGLDHNEIIRRVAGSEGFAKTPEPIEERLGPNPELDAKADSLIGGLMDSVDKVMGPQEGKVGEPDIKSVKSSDVQELERMFNLKDERGFWRMLPAKKKAPVGPGTGTALDDLTRNIESGMKAIPPDDSRMKLSERLDKTLTEGWDKVQLSLGKLAAQSVALKDAYMRPPEQTDYHSSIGRFSGSLNRSAWELRQFTKNIKEMLPDERQREGITNWLQAAGDDQVLADRAARSKGSIRAGYERARNLTQTEIGYAKMIEAHFDRRLKEAIKLGILDHGIENYVPQVWKPSDQQFMMNHFSSLTRSGLLKPDFNSAKKRIFDSYFDGEQAGHKPANKDIGFLVASWERAFNQAVASRNLIHDLSKGAASDGRPIVAPSGGVKTIYDPTTNTVDPDVSAHLIYPKTAPDETGDYKAVNHPAMTKWNWVGKDAEGNPMFLKGDLRVHPEFANKLDNIINRGKWAQDHPVQTAILKGQGFFKATLLSMSPFHQIQEGTHAIFHNVNPFSPPGIDLANPSLGKLLDRGLVIGNYDPVAAFDEGLTSGSGGAIGKIPGMGRFMQKYSDYLFSDYIPRLKAKMATEAYDRNMKRFQGALANGKITSDQIAEITAGQANAAFGELNYIMMGRHPQTQAIMRMMFLAPDFLEARARFAGQAMTPYGREQRVALLRGALGIYVTARVLNKLLDDDYHWDRKDAFSVISHGYEYKIRSLPGDIWNLMQDSNSFLQHRLSFLPRAGAERISSKDDFGRHRDMGEQIMDFARSIVPIPAQGFTKGDSGNLKQNIFSSVLSGAGITRSRYRSQAGAMAHQYAIGSNPTDATSHHISQMVQDITDGQFNGKHAREMVQEGKMNPQDIIKAAELAALPEIWRDYRNLPVELKAKIWKVATPKERAILTAYSRRELDVTRLLPEQRAEFMKSFAKQ